MKHHEPNVTRRLLTRTSTRSDVRFAAARTGDGFGLIWSKQAHVRLDEIPFSGICFNLQISAGPFHVICMVVVNVCCGQSMLNVSIQCLLLASPRTLNTSNCDDLFLTVTSARNVVSWYGTASRVQTGLVGPELYICPRFRG